MAESSKPTVDVPAETSATTTDALPAVGSTAEKAQVSDTTETVPAVKTSTGAVVGSAADATPAQTVPMLDTAAEGAKKSTDHAGPFNDGALGYKDPSTMMGKFKFSKRHVWFGDSPVSTQNMSHYLRAEKPEVAHPITAWASQTGKGLLFLAKQPDQKAQPHGALNLSEATDLAKEGIVDYSFKIHGHKHTFQASTMRERDGWYVATEKAMDGAKARRDSILGSDGYKETMGKLDKPAVMANAAAEHSTPKKSTDYRPSEDARGGRTAEAISDEEKKKKKSRSASRGKRASIFGAILGGKEGQEKHEEAKITSRRSEDTKGKAKAVEPAEEEQEVPIVASPEVTASAPPESTAEPAEPVEAKAEDKPVASTEQTEEAPKTAAATTAPMPAKPTKRGSLFGQFFDRVRTPAHEKKEHEVVPVASSKDGAVVAKPVHEPVATTGDGSTAAATASTDEPAAAKDTITSKETKEETAPKKEEKENLLGKFLNRDRSKSPAADSRNEKKDVVVPVNAPAEASAPSTNVTSAADAPTTEASVPATAATTTATPEASKDKRRTSFFGNFGNSTKKEKKPAEVNTETDKSANEHKPNSPLPRLGSIFRKPNQGVKGNKDAKTETKGAETSQTDEKPATSMETPAESAEDATPAGQANGTSSSKPDDVDAVPQSSVAEEKKEGMAPVVASTA